MDQAAAPLLIPVGGLRPKADRPPFIVGTCCGAIRCAAPLSHCANTPPVSRGTSGVARSDMLFVGLPTAIVRGFSDTNLRFRSGRVLSPNPRLRATCLCCRPLFGLPATRAVIPIRASPMRPCHDGLTADASLASDLPKTIGEGPTDPDGRTGRPDQTIGHNNNSSGKGSL